MGYGFPSTSFLVLVFALTRLNFRLSSFYQWDIAIIRIGLLTSEMRLSIGGQSVGGSNGNADELTN